MDLATLLANKPLLADLQREYEVLKHSNVRMDYEAWIKRRLAEVAAAAAAGAGGAPGRALHAPPTTRIPAAPQPRSLLLQQELALRRAGVNVAPPTQLSLGADLAAVGPGPGALRDPSGVVSIVGAAAEAGPELQQPAWRTPKWRAADVTNVQAVGASDAALQGQLAVRKPARPDWVHAATLEGALRGSRVVPLMHAAAERERRLAVSSALARQQRAMGVDAAQWRKQQQERSEQQGAEAGRGKENGGQLENVTALAQQLAEQTQGLQQLVQQQQTQLQQQQALLRRALGDEAVEELTGPAPGADGGSGGADDALPAALKRSWLLRAVGVVQSPEAAAAAPSSAEQPGDAAAATDEEAQQQRQALKRRLKQLLASNGRGMTASELAASLQGLLQRGVSATAAPLPGAASAARAQQRRASVEAAEQPSPAAAEPRPAGTRRKGRPGWDNSLPEPQPRNRRQASQLDDRRPPSKQQAAPARPVPRTAGSERQQDVSSRVGEGIARLQAAMGSAVRCQRAAAAPQASQAAPPPATDAVAAIELQVQQQLRQEEAAAEEQERLQRLADLEGRMLVAVTQMERRLQAPAPPPALQPAPAPAAPPAALDAEALQQVLRSLEGMESREREVRQRWLQPQRDAPASPGKVPALEVDAAGSLRALPSQQQSTAPRPCGGHQQPEQQQTAEPDPISDAMLKSVLRGRKRFMKRRSLVHGGAGGLQPCKVVEQVAGLLIDELLAEQAAELGELCDSMGELLFDTEFAG